MPLTPTSLAQLLHGDLLSAEVLDAELPLGRVETDSRRISSGDLFWALKGPRYDGHDYVASAIAQSASAIVVEERWLRQAWQTRHFPERRVPTVVVANTLAAFGQYAAWHRRRHDLLAIGVTGSVGKTTTRHLIHTVLSTRYRGMQSPQNFNNHVGVPLSLLAIQPEDEFAVIECGASHVGEIRQLAELFGPEYGVITSIAPAHLDGFGNIEGVCRAKGELFEALPPNGLAIVNGDDPLARALIKRANCRSITVGEHLLNEVRATNVRCKNGSMEFEVDRSHFDLPVTGRSLLTSGLIALAMARELGLSDAEINEGFRQFQPLAGRSCPIALGKWTVIDDTYNASPASMQAACATLSNWQPVGHGKRILIVGDMLSLGPKTDHYHQELGATIANSGIDRLLAIGSQAATVARTAKESGMDAGCLGACRDMETLEALLDCWLEPGDVILVKGSRAMQMEQVVEKLRNRDALEHQSTQTNERIPAYKAA
ncbi:MAG: UDP-N-acetylmuramoyl-tripeptide--D-alanyl-D-alanine ligase [Planctomycetaceae bacterium]